MNKKFDKKQALIKIALIIIGVTIILAITHIFLMLNSNDPLKGTSWTRTTEVDSEYINFYDNGNFSYYYGVGNPVDNSDLCETYQYNEKDKLITLNCNSIISVNDRIKVDSIDDKKIVLIFGNEKRIFEKVKR
jgi:flagellar basal body-associated protein FliL